MISIHFEDNDAKIETAEDVLDFIRKYVPVATPLTIHTVDDAGGTIIVIAGIEEQDK